MIGPGSPVRHLAFPLSADLAITALIDAVRLKRMTIEEFDRGDFNVRDVFPAREQQIGFALTQLVVGANELIANANLVIDDLRRLGASPGAFTFPDHRYALLLRTFFSEFGRAFDLFSHFMAAVVKAGAVSKADAEGARKEFYDAFRTPFAIRNTNTHVQLVVPRDSVRLLIGAAVESTGRWQLVDSKTQEPFRVDKELQNICPARATAYTDLLRRLRNSLERIVLHADEMALPLGKRRSLERARRRRARQRSRVIQLRFQIPI